MSPKKVRRGLPPLTVSSFSASRGELHTKPLFSSVLNPDGMQTADNADILHGPACPAEPLPILFLPMQECTLFLRGTVLLYVPLREHTLSVVFSCVFST